MTIPEPAPWGSPLEAPMIYEIMRARFLDNARAVANIDVHDLVARSDTSVFDSAVSAESGLITLNGRHCYPWRVRKDDLVHFADHICVQFDTHSNRNRWCIAPSKAPQNAVWRLVRIGNAAPDSMGTKVFFRHMALRHPTASISKIVPKTALVEHPPLLKQSRECFDHSPVRMPEIQPKQSQCSAGNVQSSRQ